MVIDTSYRGIDRVTIRPFMIVALPSLGPGTDTKPGEHLLRLDKPFWLVKAAVPWGNLDRGSGK
ncbi:hypothetical protein [Nocardia rosealba]|uniref:hypothetical protein n=1 Tax=Nocardia rosealba TaxID=2878563 RepID=UPI001CDA499A|nr:hypothetical protein [Nocardia rosealba]MCA2206187.1 hypothetical protein [Nocardia rosealba]